MTEFLVNTITDGDQISPSVTPLSGEKFLVAWNSKKAVKNSMDVYDIYAQIFSAPGQKFGGEFLVNSDNVGSKISPTVANLSNGGFVVSWVSVKSAKSDIVAEARIFQEDGTPLAPGDIKLSSDVEKNINDISISGLQNGGFIATWSSQNGPSDVDGSIYDVYARIFDATGAPSGEQFLVNTYQKGIQWGAKVVTLQDGKFVICWSSYLQDGSDMGVYAQMYSDSGSKIGQEFQINTYTKYAQSTANIAALSTGGFVITWTSAEQDGSSYGIYAQAYGANGEKVGGENLVNTRVEGSQDHSSVTALPNGEFFVTWSSYEQGEEGEEDDQQDGEDEKQDIDGCNILGQKFTAAAKKSGPEFQVNVYAQGNQWYQSSTSLSNDNVIVAWMSEGQVENGYDIFAQGYTKDLEPIETDILQSKHDVPSEPENSISAASGESTFADDQEETAAVDQTMTTIDTNAAVKPEIADEAIVTTSAVPVADHSEDAKQANASTDAAPDIGDVSPELATEQPASHAEL